MRRSLCAILLASFLPLTALAESSEDAPAPREETLEQKKARLESERDAARIKALNYGLPWYTQEAADKQKELDDLAADHGETAADQP